LTFVISLFLTLAIELPLALLWGLRGRALIMVTLANIMTNPLAVALHTAIGIPQLPIEIGVVAVEAVVYRTFSRTPGWEIPKPLWLAVVSNTVSWGLGLVLQL
jgi:hypothetical protein